MVLLAPSFLLTTIISATIIDSKEDAPQQTTERHSDSKHKEHRFENSNIGFDKFHKEPSINVEDKTSLRTYNKPESQIDIEALLNSKFKVLLNSIHNLLVRYNEQTKTAQLTQTKLTEPRIRKKWNYVVKLSQALPVELSLHRLSLVEKYKTKHTYQNLLKKHLTSFKKAKECHAIIMVALDNIEEYIVSWNGSTHLTQDFVDDYVVFATKEMKLLVQQYILFELYDRMFKLHLIYVRSMNEANLQGHYFAVKTVTKQCCKKISEIKRAIKADYDARCLNKII